MVESREREVGARVCPPTPLQWHPHPARQDHVLQLSKMFLVVEENVQEWKRSLQPEEEVCVGWERGVM